MNHSDFDWDFENITHLARHGVTPEEAESVSLGSPMFLRHQTVDGELRFVEVGPTSRGRMLEIVSTLRDYRVRFITAYDADKRSVRQYFAEFGA
jgi:uncharacterized DUF497 family protein